MLNQQCATCEFFHAIGRGKYSRCHFLVEHNMPECFHGIRDPLVNQDDGANCKCYKIASVSKTID